MYYKKLLDTLEWRYTGPAQSNYIGEWAKWKAYVSRYLVGGEMRYRLEVTREHGVIAHVAVDTPEVRELYRAVQNRVEVERVAQTKHAKASFAFAFLGGPPPSIENWAGPETDTEIGFA